jgi:hypothetical protein
MHGSANDTSSWLQRADEALVNRARPTGYKVGGADIRPAGLELSLLEKLGRASPQFLDRASYVGTFKLPRSL